MTRSPREEAAQKALRRVMNVERLSLAKLARGMVAGAVTVEELVSHCLARIGAHDSALHAIRALHPQAIEDARMCDAQLGAGRQIGPLHGIPLVVKDNIDILDMPTTSGCHALAGSLPQRDSAQVARLRAAGAVIVAKANLSEFSFEIRSRSSLGGDTLNPFRFNTTSGGSSGGTAVAVAAGFAWAGIGTDTGGSIRIPAAFNGLVGVRPTYGRLSLEGVAPLAPSTDTIGPIARCVGDAALLLEVMSGRRWDHHGVEVHGRRIGVLRQACGESPSILQAIDASISALIEAGAIMIDPVSLPREVLPIGGMHIVDTEFGTAFDAYLNRNFVAGTAPTSLAQIVASGALLRELEPALRARLAHRNERDRPAILARHALLRNALATLLRDQALDAILYPTSVVVPDGLDNPKCGWGAELAAQSGWPAVSVPSGRRKGGIPIGVELLGPPDSEALLLGIAAAIEWAAGPRAVPLL